MKLSLLAIAILLILFAAYSQLFPPTPTFTSPLSSITTNPSEQSTQPISVIGFLPYWTLSSAPPISPNITDIMYFSLTLDSTGNLITDNGLRRIKQGSDLILPHQQLHLVFTVLNTSDIEDLLSNPANINNAVNSIISQTNLHSAHGINLDFEPDTPVNQDTASLFTEFVITLNNQLEKKGLNKIISIDIFPDPRYQSLWQLDKLKNHADYFISMSYDYHRRNSSQAGPIAPIYGKSQGLWSSDVFTSLTGTLSTIPAEQLILGVPLYGYEWHTTTKNHLSNTYPNSGRLATYARAQKTIKDKKLPVNWDPIALSPWFVYEQDDQIMQIYFENNQSILLKLSLINQTNVSGIAFWALGYEAEYKNVWHLFNQNEITTKNMSFTH